MSTPGPGPQQAAAAEKEEIRVLFVGGDEGDVSLFRALLEGDRPRFVVDHVSSLPQAFERLERNQADVLVLDVGEGHTEALTGLSQTRVRHPLVPVVVLADTDHAGLANRALEAGARGYLVRCALSQGFVVWSLLHAIRNQRIFVELNIARERARQLATYDQLTGLANRSLFADRLDQAVSSARRNRHTLAVLFIDLDHFKLVNDTLGHVAGDALLRSTAQRIGSCLRKSDTGARLGGDEFAVLVTHLSSPSDAEQIAEKLLDLIRKPVRLRTGDRVVSASIGIATFPHHGTDAEALLKASDSAMYHAKSAGRDRYAVYAEDMYEEASDRTSLEYRLRDALEGGELALHYQPVVDVVRGRVVGAEALIRWRHPELGLVLPAEFLRIAEDSNLIIPIGEWVIRTACEQAAAWQEMGHKGFRIAVNVSPQQFQPDDFVTRVNEVLEDTGLRPESLELELTERSLLHDTRRTLAQFSALKRLGVRISIDDFGTGYSALAYLKQLPVDVLKIDQSFIRALTTDPADATITQTVVQLARALNLATIGEGVETVEQMQLLASFGCSRMQGFLFGEATDATSFEYLLTAPNFWWMADDEDAAGAPTL